MLQQRFLGHDRLCAGGAQLVGEARLWMLMVKRNVGGARLEDAQQRDHHVARTVRDQAHGVAGCDAGLREARREFARLLVELGVGECALLVGNRDARGLSRCPRGDALMDQLIGIARGRRTLAELGEHLLARRLVELRKRRDGHARVGRDAGQQRAQARRQLLGLCGGEIGGVEPDPDPVYAVVTRRDPQAWLQARKGAGVPRESHRRLPPQR